MNDYNETIYPLYLSHMTLPGTHDSCSSHLTDIIIDVNKIDNDLVNFAHFLHIPLEKLVSPWARAQSVGAYDQLLGGIRYLDIRACCYNGEWRTHHGSVLSKTKMSNLFSDIGLFLDQHPGEVIVVELSHFWSSSSDESSLIIERGQLVEMILAKVGDRMLSRRTGLISVGEMVHLNERLIVTVEFPTQDEHFWGSSTLVNSYANTPILSEMEDFNTIQLHRIDTHSPSASLFKISWTLTANAKTILDSGLLDHPSTLLRLADIANVDLSRWVSETRSEGDQLGNILLVDHFQTSHILEVILNHSIYRAVA